MKPTTGELLWNYSRFPCNKATGDRLFPEYKCDFSCEQQNVTAASCISDSLKPSQIKDDSVTGQIQATEHVGSSSFIYFSNFLISFNLLFHTQKWAKENIIWGFISSFQGKKQSYQWCLW